MFLLYFLAVRSRKCLEKFSWCQVWCFLGSFSLPLVFSSTSFFAFFVFWRDTAQVVTGHPHTHFLFVPFLFLCPAALLVSPFLAVRPDSWRFSRGAILGPARFWDSPWTYGAWARSPLPRPLSWDARRQGFSVLLLPCFSFSPFVLFCGFTHLRLTRRPSQWLDLRQARGARRPAPRPSEGQGEPLCGRRVGPLLFWDFVAFFCMAEGHRDPRTRSVRGLFVREGAFCLPPQALFFHTHVSSRPRVFFVFFLFLFGLRGPHAVESWMAQMRVNEWNLYSENGMSKSELY